MRGHIRAVKIILDRGAVINAWDEVRGPHHINAGKIQNVGDLQHQDQDPKCSREPLIPLVYDWSLLGYSVADSVDSYIWRYETA